MILQAREQREKKFFERTMLACRRDPLSSHLMDSYKAAVNEPGNELVRLYEIRDALANHYGGEHEAKKRLNISRKNWSRFGAICNDEPLRQGRHNGRHIKNLRDTRAEELHEARELTKEFIIAHFDLVLNITS